MERTVLKLLLAVAVLASTPVRAFADDDNDTCARPAAGSLVTPPPDLFSNDGVLNVTFNYFTALDSVGRTLFCFMILYKVFPRP